MEHKLEQLEAAMREEQERQAFFLQKKKSRRRSSLNFFHNITKDLIANQQANIMISDEEREQELKNSRKVKSVKDLMRGKSFIEKVEFIKNNASNFFCEKCCLRSKRVKKIPSAHSGISIAFESSNHENPNPSKEVELEYEKLLKQGIIKQDHPGRKNWDVLIICFSLYNCIELPMEIAFEWRKELDKNNLTEKLNNVIDFMFFVDIVMNFRTTYFNPRTGEEIIQKDLIKRNYLCGQFIIDLFSTIPFDVIYEVIFMQDD